LTLASSGAFAVGDFIVGVDGKNTQVPHSALSQPQPPTHHPERATMLFFGIEFASCLF
jgi:hypothetical protein